MLASSFLTRPKPAALPANSLYLLSKPTFSVAWVTMGKNVMPSGARVLSAKNAVTDVSPPARMFLASSTLMFLTALTSRVLPIGTAASAARLSDSVSSSTRLPWPRFLSSPATSFR